MAQPPVTGSLLIPLDGSPLADRAIPLAAAIGSPDAGFVLLRVLPPPSLADEVLARRQDGDGSAAESAAMAALERSAALLPDRRVERAVAHGDPAETIAAEAEARGVGCVVVASRGRGAIGRWLFGSVADRLARISRVPVLIVRADEDDAPPSAPRRLVVPLDGSDRARQALPVASALADAHAWPVHLLTAIDVSTLAPVAVPGVVMPMSGEVYEQVYDDLTGEAKRGLAEAAAELSAAGIAVSTEVRTGPAVMAIDDVLRAGDLVVLTSHGRTGVARWLLGSVAEELVRSAPAPVLLVPAADRGNPDRA